MQQLRFQPRLVPALGATCLLLLFLYLGQWQAGKAERVVAERLQHAQRAALQETRIGNALVDAAALHYAPVVVRGEYEPAGQFFVDNRQENGRPGLHVVTPLKIEGTSTHILVNRGWVAWENGRTKLPKVTTPPGVQELRGVAVVPVHKKFWLMPERAEAWAELWPRLDVQRYAQKTNGPVQPIVILQNSRDTEDGLLRNWPAPEDRAAMHQSYSAQWYGMAVALLIFFVAASVRTTPRIR
jgi:surfeit locus 1 family protein